MKRSLFPIFFLAFVMSLTQVKAQAPHLFEYTYPVIHEEQPQIRTLMEKVSIFSPTIPDGGTARWCMRSRTG